MNINKLFNNKEYLEQEISFFTTKKHIRKINNNPELVQAHLKKARHNLEFYKLNKDYQRFNDWLIVALYYALYHSALALITNRNHSSKNHYATILILIQEYSITEEEASLLNELSISKNDAELYTQLKNERHDASYVTNTKFNTKSVQEYEDRVIDFLNKAEEMIQ